MFESFDLSSGKRLREAAARARTPRDREDFLDAIVAAAIAAMSAGEQSSKQRFTDLPPLQLGDTADVLCVLQHEVGFVASPPIASLASGTASSIMSSEATSCAIVALRSHVQGTGSVVSLAHFDHGGEDVAVTLVEMLRRCLCVEGSADTAICIDVYVVGGAASDKSSSIDTLFSVFAFFANHSSLSLNQEQGVKKITWNLRLEGSAFWTLNTNESDSRCIVRGICIDATDGNCRPCEFATRSYAEPWLRNLRFCGDGNAVSWISTLDAKEGSRVQAAVMTGLPGGAVPQQVVIVRPFVWDRYMVLMGARMKEEQLLAFSTTPDMEPPDFCRTMKNSLVYGATHDPETVFAGQAPLLLVRVESLATAGKGSNSPWICIPWPDHMISQES